MNKLINTPRIILALLALLFISDFAQAQPGFRNARRYQGYGYGEQRRWRSYNYGHGYYHSPYRYYNRPYYRPYSFYPGYASPYGLYLSRLPFGYMSLRLNTGLFFYSDGMFYRRRQDLAYETVAPPMGAVVSKIPASSKIVVINNQTYYEYRGSYYQEEIRDKNTWYKVVGINGSLQTQDQYDDQNEYDPETMDQSPASPRIGDQFDALPEGSKVVVYNNQKYFKSPENIYFQEVIHDNKLFYEVTVLPEDN